MELFNHIDLKEESEKRQPNTEGEPRSPSFLIAQAIFETNLFPYYTPTFLKPSSFYTHLPAYEDGTECSETSECKIETLGNYPEESIQVLFPYLCLIYPPHLEEFTSFFHHQLLPHALLPCLIASFQILLLGQCAM
jgi:hypothetical protein